MFTAANVESLPSASIKSWCDTWLEAKSIEAEETTHARHKRVIERFSGFLGEAKSNRDLDTLQASDIVRFRDCEVKERARATANLRVKVLRVCFGEAVRQGVAHGQSGGACQAAQINCGIEATAVHAC